MTLDKGNDTALTGAGWTGVTTGILRVLMVSTLSSLV